MSDTSLKQALLKLLQDDEQSTDAILEQVDRTNQDIIGQDMVRRNQGQSDSVNSDDLKMTNLHNEGGQQVKITGRTIHAIGQNILTSDAIVGMVARMEKLETDHENRIKDLENQNLKLQIRLGDVERDESVRVSERIADMPSNNVLTLDIEDGYSIGADHTAHPMTNGRSEAVKTIHEVGMLTQQIAKSTGYNGGQNV